MKKRINRWKNIICGKTKGDSTYVATIISIFVLIALFAVLFHSVVQISAQNKIERVYRKYLLSMETQGCLTHSAKAQLINDLTEAGLKNIDLSGTSQSPVSYGDTVVLHIVGDLTIDTVKEAAASGGGKTFRKGQEVIHIDITKTGTALYD